jgi:hypothetical protein
VNDVGYATLNNFVRLSNDNLEAVNWLLSDEDALRYFTFGGSPEGTYYSALVQLSRLYAEYKDDMSNDLYKRMVIALSLSHATATCLWVDGTNEANGSDPVDRYAIYKQMYLAGKLYTEQFEDNNIEEMRWTLNSVIDDESIEWLRDWTYNKGLEGKADSLDPYTYVTYRWFDYNQEQYHSEENREMWDTKYGLSKYGITYSDAVKTWIVFEEGGVCGAISKVGATIRNVYGQPASVVCQPGHAAYIVNQYNNGNRYWTLYNDVFGWAQTGRTERLNYRMMCDWGERTGLSWTWPMTYIFLAQEAINDWDSYEAAERILMLADVYADDEGKLEEIYKAALDEEAINFDAIWNLTKLYVSQGRSDEELLELASCITETFKYHPLPMNDLMTILKEGFSSSNALASATLMQNNALNAATKTTASQSLQYQGVRAMANSILGNEDTTVATFSFTGDDANVLQLGERFQGNGVAWEYRIDGENWISVNGDSVTLNPDDITTANGIQVHIVGTDYTDSNIYSITVTQGAAITTYANNWEGKLMGSTTNIEYQVDGEDEWYDLTEEGRLFGITKDETIHFRTKGDGTQKPGAIRTVTFTAHNFTNGNYLSIEHMTAEKWPVVDGKIYSYCTFGSAPVIIELDDTYNVSGGWYVCDQKNNTGRIKSLTAYTSMDGETWTEVMTNKTLENSTDPQEFKFDITTEAKYVKYVANSTYGGNARAEMLMVAYDDTVASAFETESYQYVCENGIMSGTDEESFNAEGNLTRQDFIQALYVMAGSPSVSGTAPMKDFDKNADWADAVVWAYKKNIISASKTSTFAPTGRVTREQFVTVLARYAAYIGLDTTTTYDFKEDFFDGTSISKYASKSMSWAVENGLITGTTDTEMSPKGYMTRGIAADAFYHLIDCLNAE